MRRVCKKNKLNAIRDYPHAGTRLHSKNICYETKPRTKALLTIPVSPKIDKELHTFAYVLFLTWKNLLYNLGIGFIKLSSSHRHVTRSNSTLA